MSQTCGQFKIVDKRLFGGGKVAVFVLTLMVLAPLVALAQTPTPAAADRPSPVVATPTEPTTPLASSAPSVVSATSTVPEFNDVVVSAQDLGARDASVLPGDFFYGFKNFGRNTRLFFAFNPVRKAELKLEYANQALHEARQLIESRGFERVSSDAVAGAMRDVEQRLSSIRADAEELKKRKATDPERVELFLNKLTDKQILQTRALDKLADDITKIKETRPQEAAKVDRVFVALEEAKDKNLGHLGAVLSTVEESQDKVAARLTEVVTAQPGSELKGFKQLEVLKTLEDQVPAEAKAAIRKAQEDSVKKVEAVIQAMPPAERAVKIEQYVSQHVGDKLKLLEILDDIKQTAGLPEDALRKLETAKTIAVKDFAKKVEAFSDNKLIQDRFFQGVEDGDVSAVRAIEDLEGHLVQASETMKTRLDKGRKTAIKAFTDTFTDAASADQARLFEALAKDMTAKPDAKTFRLMQELEDQVKSDPTKAKFIQGLEAEVARSAETRARIEGRRYFERMVSLDPKDLDAVNNFAKQAELPAVFSQEFTRVSADNYNEYIRTINSFERLNEFTARFADVSIETIDEFRQQTSFDEALQYKKRAIAKLQLDVEEIERKKALDQKLRAQESAMRAQIESAKNADERARIFKERKEAELKRFQEELDLKYGALERQMSELDPFCRDAKCQQAQRGFFETQKSETTQAIADTFIAQAINVWDPFQGKCATPEACAAYCKTNPKFGPCTAYIPAIEPRLAQVTCRVGEYFNFESRKCLSDPYSKPPEDFRQCGPGYHWVEQGAFCELDRVTTLVARPLSPDYRVICGPSSRFNPSANACVPVDWQACGPGQYFDFIEKKCRREAKTCAQGQYYDFGQEACINVPYEPTIFRPDFVPVPVLTQITCAAGYFWRPEVNQCEPVTAPQACERGTYWDPVVARCLRASDEVYCGASMFWDAAARTCRPIDRPPLECPIGVALVCGTDGKTYPSACHARQNSVQVAYSGRCEIYCTDEYKPVCDTNNRTQTNKCYAARAGIGVQYEGVCKNEPPIGSCPPGFTQDASGKCISTSPTSTSTPPVPWCGPGSWYDSEFGKCLTEQEHNRLRGCTNDQYWDAYYRICKYFDCPSGWRWDSAARTCVSLSDPTCKQSCGASACTGGTYCMFDTKGCALGCSPTCPSGESWDQAQKKCVPYRPACPFEYIWDDVEKRCRPAGGPISTSTTPNITSISPSSGPIGTPIRLTGTGFTATGNRVNFDSGIIPDLASSDSTSLTFPVPSDRVPYCAIYPPNCLLPAPYNPVTPGTYKVTVQNAKGVSNAVYFSVTGSGMPPTACPSDRPYWDQATGSCKQAPPLPGTTCPAGFHPHTANSGTNFCMNDAENMQGTCYDASGKTVIKCPEFTFTPGNQNWVRQTWTFSDGGTESSYILNRTDREYLDFIARIKAQCLTITRSRFTWKTGAGSDSDWQSFGIPDCSGTYTQPTCPSGQWWDSYSSSCRSSTATSTYPGDATSCPGFSYSRWDSTGRRYCQLNNTRSCEYSYPAYLTESNYTPGECPVETTPPPSGDCDSALVALLGTDCHYMYNDSSGNRIYCNGPMTKSAKRGDTTTTPGCSGSGPPPGPGTIPSVPAGVTATYRASSRDVLVTWPDNTIEESFKIFRRAQGSSWNYLGPAPSVAGAQVTYVDSLVNPGTTFDYMAQACVSAGCSSDSNIATVSIPLTPPPTTGTCGDRICGSSETAATCPADCGSTPPPSGDCDSALIALLGTDCHYMYSDTSGNRIFCNGPMTKSAKRGDTATIPGCSSPSTPSTCPSGQWWDSATNACRSSTSTTCPAGEFWDPGYNRCRVACTTGQYWDSATNTCKQSSVSICSADTIWDEVNKTCRRPCTSEQAWDNISQTCTSTACTSPYSQSGSRVCQTTVCPNGCTYDPSGCPNGCVAPPLVATTSPPVSPACPDNGYNTGGGKAACNYSTCQSGCNFSAGCPTSCYTPPAPPPTTSTTTLAPVIKFLASVWSGLTGILQNLFGF